MTYLALRGGRCVVEEPWQRIGLPTDSGNTTWGNLVGLNGFVFNAFLFACVVARWRTASAPTRRVHGPVWAGAAVLALLVAANTTASWLKLPTAVQLALVLPRCSASSRWGGRATARPGPRTPGSGRC